MLIYVNKVGKDKIRSSFFDASLYMVVGFLLMEIFRGIASMAVAGSNIGVILQFVMTDMLSLVFAILVVIVVRKMEGIFQDQKQYLLELNSQKENIDGGWQDE